MLAYVVRRILWAGVLAVAMTFVTFVIVFEIPSDPARFLVPNQNPSEHQLEAAREKLGVDDPFFSSTAASSRASRTSTWASRMGRPASAPQFP
jgi:ABC-type dipeptide/oligopeptide/nickel transport system permease component